jgi:DDE superfamily endonuclease
VEPVFPNVNNNNRQAIDEWFWCVSVDGTHCRIEEPRNRPEKNWYSHKHHKPCVAYEIAIDLQESRIIWVSGPHFAGDTDLVIFRKEGGLKDHIPDGFKAIGDKGYIGEDKVSINNELDPLPVKIFKRIARARHEDVSGRIKRFDILSDRFRHGVNKHKTAFEAVCVLVQYTLENGHPLHTIPVDNLV